MEPDAEVEPRNYRIYYTDMTEQCDTDGYYRQAHMETVCYSIEELVDRIRDLEANVRENSKDYTKRFEPVVDEVICFDEIDSNIYAQAQKEGVQIGADRLRAKSERQKQRVQDHSEETERNLYEKLKRKYESKLKE